MRVPHNAAFVALASVLIISAIFLVVCVGAVSYALSTKGTTLAYVDHDRARAYAYACGEHALLALGRSLEYHGNETLALADGTCIIDAIGGTGNSDLTLITTGYAGESVYKVRIHIATLIPSPTVASFEIMTP